MAGWIVLGGGVVLTVVAAIVMQNSSNDLLLIAFLGIPLGVTVALAGWYLLIWATPLTDAFRRRGRLLRVIGATTSAVSGGLIVTAGLYALAEVDLPRVLNVLASAAIIGFPLGFLLIVCGWLLTTVGLRGDASAVRRVADRAPS
jgi:cytochrome bd-type quinol oxidase subunit 1